MLYPQVSAEEWMKRYDLEVEPCQCAECGKWFTPSVPFACKDIRGLETSKHGCKTGPSCIYTYVNEKAEEVKRLIGNL